MFLVDDVLLFPARSLFWLCREIHNAVRQELVSEKDNITSSLNELYMLLETKQISDAEFDQREKELLDRLDQLQDTSTVLTDEEDEDEEEEDEGE